MAHTIDRRRLLKVGATFAASALLLPRAGAHEVVTTTLRVVHPWSRATAPEAKFAVLCMNFEDVDVDDRLVSVASPVAAGAEMGGPDAGPRVDFFIPRAKSTELAEKGRHVRLTGLRFPLAAGTSHPVQLGFEKGGVYLTTFTVDFERFA